MELNHRYVLLLCIVAPLYAITIDCGVSNCAQTEFMNVRPSENITLITSWHRLQGIRPHYLNRVKEIRLNNSIHNITILSIGTLLRKVPSLRTINLLNHTYSSIQVPMSGRRKYLYRNLIKMMGLSLFHISDDVMKWLGGLETVQLTVNDVTKSRFNGLGKAKNIKLFVPHAYSINAIYLGNECNHLGCT